MRLQVECEICALSLMPFGNSEMNVPEGQMRIAERFNAGMYATPEQVPKGRLKDGANGYTFNRSFGTLILRTSFPALKRRATLATFLRDNCSRYDLGISVRHSPKPQGLGKYFGG